LRVGAEHAPGHADEIANVQRFIEFKGFFAQFFNARINLHAVVAALNMGKRGFALNAHGHDAASGGNRVFLFFERLFRFIVILAQ